MKRGLRPRKKKEEKQRRRLSVEGSKKPKRTKIENRESLI